MLIEQRVGLKHQSVGGRIPKNLVDADFFAGAGVGKRVAKINEIDRIAIYTSHIDRAGEWHGNAWLRREAIERVQHIAVGAIAWTDRAIRLG